VPIRKNLAVHRDPYLATRSLRALKEGDVCGRCGVVYRHKRWSMDYPPLMTKGREVRKVICPACRKIRDHFSGGIITLRGDFLKTHKDQILQLIRNEETRAMGINPLERVISIKDKKSYVEIHTTNERFAQRVGREIKRAYKGRVAYHWSGDNKSIRVEWHRSEEKER
jgi:NMD protein affecting ribosome stability and mRNA decay